MAYKIIRPRHGIKSLWNRYKSRIYKLGEMLVESPESGVGSGPVNIKFGDGVTDYEKLPYAVLAPVDEVSEGVKNPVTSDAVKKALGNVSVEVVDNLESTSTKLALSANQGRLLNNKVADCFQSVSDGKALVASAITGKGVTTASDATFETMANNVSSIGFKLIFNTGDNSDAEIPSWKSVVGKKYIISYCARNSSASGINGGTISKSRYVTMWGSGNVIYQYVIEAVATKTTMSLSQSQCYGVVYEV